MSIVIPLVEVAACDRPVQPKSKTDRHARIVIVLSELKQFYVPGDTISGKIILTISHALYKVSSVCAYLQCHELLRPAPIGDESSFRIVPKESFDELLQKCRSDRCGQFEAEFNITLDQYSALTYPPTHLMPGKLPRGVMWTLHAEAGFTKYPSAFLTLEDVVQIDFYPTDIKSYKPNDLRRTFHCPNYDITVTCPYFLPQWPASTYLEFEGNLPTDGKFNLNVYLEKKSFNVDQYNTALGHCDSILLCEMPDFKLSRTDSSIIVRLQLKKRLPSPFVSEFFTSHYMILVRIGNNKLVCLLKCFPISVLPPLPEAESRSKDRSARPPAGCID